MLKRWMLICLAGLLASFFSYSSPAMAVVDVLTYIPKNAVSVLPVIKKESMTYYPDFKYQAYFASLIELESCISLTHSRCFDPRAKLSSARELGIGVGQLTKAYNKDGSVRFDSLAELKAKHFTELYELDWATLQNRTDLQVRALVLMTRDNYKQLYNISDSAERLAFADSAYNGGFSGMQKKRRYCGLSSHCDPKKWFDNVEKVCLTGNARLYGNRSACDINKHHVIQTTRVRIVKYRAYF